MKSAKISYDINKDIDNRITWCNKQSHWVDRKQKVWVETYEYIYNKPKEESGVFVQNMINQKYISKIYDNQWRLLEVLENNQYQLQLKKLESTIGYKIPFEEISIYITSFPRWSYNPKKWYFLCYYKNQSPIKSLLHETLHFIFHHNFSYLVDENILSYNEFEELKEAQTVILNDIFCHLFTVNNTIDKWYLKHQKLREYLSKVRAEGNDFDKLIKNGVEYIKN